MLIRVSSGAATDISHGFAGALQPGTAANHLRVVRSGTTIAVEINQQLIAQVNDGTIVGESHFGVAMMPYSGQWSADSRFDNFLVSSNGLPTAAAGPAQAASRGATAADALFKALQTEDLFPAARP